MIGHRVYIPFTKCQVPTGETTPAEPWVYSSPDLLTVDDPNDATWGKSIHKPSVLACDLWDQWTVCLWLQLLPVVCVLVSERLLVLAELLPEGDIGVMPPDNHTRLLEENHLGAILGPLWVFLGLKNGIRILVVVMVGSNPERLLMLGRGETGKLWQTYSADVTTQAISAVA